jgi:hypothetical protein
MRVREDDRNMVLLGAVTLLSAAIAGLVAVVDPAPEPSVAKSASLAAEPAPVRTVGTPFVPNVNPRER